MTGVWVSVVVVRRGGGVLVGVGAGWVTGWRPGTLVVDVYSF